MNDLPKRINEDKSSGHGPGKYPPLDSERMDGFQKFKRQNKRLNLVFKMIPIRFLWDKY